MVNVNNYFTKVNEAGRSCLIIEFRSIFSGILKRKSQACNLAYSESVMREMLHTRVQYNSNVAFHKIMINFFVRLHV